MTCKWKNVDNSDQFDLLAYLCYVMFYLYCPICSLYQLPHTKKLNDVNALLNATEIVLILT